MEAPGVDEQLVGSLVERARSEGLSLTGPDGLLGRLTKRVLESARLALHDGPVLAAAGGMGFGEVHACERRLVRGANLSRPAP